MEFLLEVYQLNKFVALSFSSFSLNELFFILSSPVFLFNLLSIRFFFARFHSAARRGSPLEHCFKFLAGLLEV